AGAVDPQNSHNSQQRSNNSTTVTTWDVDEPWSPVGHVSYITMQNNTSYSWPLGILHPSQLDSHSPSVRYTDLRSQDSAGVGYVLDFGSRLNAKFQNALIHAYDKEGGGKHMYTIWN